MRPVNLNNNHIYVIMISIARFCTYMVARIEADRNNACNPISELELSIGNAVGMTLLCTVIGLALGTNQQANVFIDGEFFPLK